MLSKYLFRVCVFFNCFIKKVIEIEILCELLKIVKILEYSFNYGYLNLLDNRLKFMLDIVDI